MKAICQLAGIPEEYFPTDFARIILISRMILSMIKVRTVSLGEMASGFAGRAKTDSNERRMRRFLANFPLDPDFIVFFIASKLPEGKWIITVDRTEWEFGKMKTDILMLAVVCKGVAVPLLWKFLTKKDDPNVGKKGNSNTGERKELMERFLRLFGKERIEAIAADREFIGNPWFPGMKENDTDIVIRIRENQQAGNSGGIFTRVSHLFRNLRIGEFRIPEGLRKIGNTEVFVCGMKLPCGKYLIIVTYESPEKDLETYNRRWQIGTMFACLKTRGFRFESAHLGDYDRISKLPESSQWLLYGLILSVTVRTKPILLLSKSTDIVPKAFFGRDSIFPDTFFLI